MAHRGRLWAWRRDRHGYVARSARSGSVERARRRVSRRRRSAGALAREGGAGALRHSRVVGEVRSAVGVRARRCWRRRYSARRRCIGRSAAGWRWRPPAFRDGDGARCGPGDRSRCRRPARGAAPLEAGGERPAGSVEALASRPAVRGGMVPLAEPQEHRWGPSSRAPPNVALYVLAAVGCRKQDHVVGGDAPRRGASNRCEREGTGRGGKGGGGRERGMLSGVRAEGRAPQAPRAPGGFRRRRSSRRRG